MDSVRSGAQTVFYRDDYTRNGVFGLKFIGGAHDAASILGPAGSQNHAKDEGEVSFHHLVFLLDANAD
jgi:hypothetical protein